MPATDQDATTTDRVDLTESLAGLTSEFASTDPEFVDLFDAFAFDEVPDRVPLDDHTRALGWLSTLVGCQGIDAYRVMLPLALTMGITPTEAKEAVYQATAYLGLGRVFPFLTATNEVLAEKDVTLPLAPQARTTPEGRREAGTQAQVDIFGDGMRDFWRNGDAEYPQINEWLAANCFGDYYTRGGLDLKARELVTFCIIAAQGGCDGQLQGHAAGNLHIGNGEALLLAVISSNLPLIGYPRTLNAITALEAAAASADKE
ncbi:MAG: carboxymuconolactone decarboxylase family protein [Atopobiaceae bacterium]|jgi:4-carboxymuconolactone decarboxylase|nr:carboxymuconolactone decarboxylase family protein [Atopobiaceae bacterium]MCH4179907.1 carboxymuconolactone decarboxylase family protein [Atopobiaceae bacterium]MCH4213658.1 carboxymuconolactone decarboxylase family protein [Atopobiaceae bacterium]MCH4230519.1 carboxymuconolactone decarboxylase family protein [Atopobiaceae bacterium]MCH4275985.1 carboxymuconolactone decarboxylase family protein [Atopobiaceae bacterium]